MRRRGGGGGRLTPVLSPCNFCSLKLPPPPPIFSTNPVPMVTAWWSHVPPSWMDAWVEKGHNSKTQGGGGGIWNFPDPPPPPHLHVTGLKGQKWKASLELISCAALAAWYLGHMQSLGVVHSVRHAIFWPLNSCWSRECECHALVLGWCDTGVERIGLVEDISTKIHSGLFVCKRRVYINESKNLTFFKI